VERRNKGKHTPLAWEAINLRLTPKQVHGYSISLN
jgi:hypothetical protein